MKELPSIAEAQQDLADMRFEIAEMGKIVASCNALILREDVDAQYYHRVSLKVCEDIRKGETVIAKILSLYPDFK